jgi:uncharacterized membrane protein YfcA
MEMQMIHMVILLITGIAVGFASGLLGVGGCFIMVPVQFWVLKAIGVDPTIAIRVAFGTNLAVVLPTAFSGALGHHRKGAVLWRAGVIIGITALIGAFIGGAFAAHLPGQYLKVGFGIAILAGAARMLTAKPPRIEDKPVDDIITYMLWGLPLGIVSGIIGIGGGVLIIPVMVIALRFNMHQAVGTSTALMIFASIGGIVSYIINGIGVSGLPAYSIGYVNLLQWVLLAVTSIFMAQIGARAAHMLPAKHLRYIFIAVMVYMGIKMTGIFSILGLPI